jgi:aminomethyltransferase
MPNGEGGIVDDLIIYRINENEYFLVVNASNIDKDWNWIQKHNLHGVEMENVSDHYSLLAIQGPKAAEAMQKLTPISLSEMVYYTFQYGTFAGVENVMVSATGYTGSGGFEIYVKNEHAEHVWNEVLKAGKEFGIEPIGLAARDTLRLEMGFCLYGNDIDDSTSPLEAGLGWITKFTKDFVDADFLKKQKEQGITRKLVAFEMVDRGIPRHGYEVYDSEGTKIGTVTSGTMSPSMKVAIGLGYVTISHSSIDSELYIAVRDKKLKARVVKLPFYKK